MKKLLFFLFLVLNIITVYACKCKTDPLAENYLAADVAGIIRIINVYGENAEQRTYKADIKFEKIYKGKEFQTLNIRGLIGNSYSGACEIDVQPGETYLILLNKYNGEYSISYCSPKYRFDMEKEKATSEVLEKAFAYIDKNKFAFIGLQFATCFDELQKGDKSDLSAIKNFTPKNTFAIYKVKVDDHSKIKELTPVTTFGDKDQEIENILRRNMIVDTPMFFNHKPGEEFLILLLYLPDNANTKYGEIINFEW
ncbi:hypothetical protein [Chryseobacterium takakiae]|uniref:Tissue inhibitor of metalloproteinase n=1 Tax=Chryseobacterium takakiae TaxID=1302685 RepID=A0A1M4Z8U6_9FLAO|nr:hypothetical protein [Chryseobacterium takakiae]SHF14358.1 hypothetical protein SAMN05444408_109170 [Chryseobacterium takakiae]